MIYLYFWMPTFTGMTSEKDFGIMHFAKHKT